MVSRQRRAYSRSVSELEAPSGGARSSPRKIRPGEETVPVPIYVVWEITMKCDQPCAHCGSRSGRARTKEISTEEAFETIDAMARLGTREVVLIGGEAYLRPDCDALVRRLVGHGIRVAIQTGGRAFTPARARTFREAGLSAVGVSIDGMRDAHDALRGNAGSFDAARRALEAGRDAGLVTTSNMQINKLNMHQLAELKATLFDVGVRAWQVQLTGPIGRAADHPEWIVDPWDVVPIIDTLARIQLEAMEEWERGGRIGRPFTVAPANNLGYFGPSEQILRSRPHGDDVHYAGCNAGMHSLGIESDGTVKGCPTLPTQGYGRGHVRDLEALWASDPTVGFARERTAADLWGFCATCYYASVCRGGCTWMAHTTLGRPGNNPFCYHRVRELSKQGVRERLVPVERAPGLPFDHGRYEIALEPITPDGEVTALRSGRRLPLVR